MIILVRIATWNMDTNAGHDAVDLLVSLDADVLLLTEPPPNLVLPGYELTEPGARMSRGQLWAAVASRAGLTCLESPHAVSTAAVVRGITFVCTVLPWAGAEQDPWTGSTVGERTVGALEQLEPFLREQPRLVWGGDWNHTMDGPLDGSSQAGRDRLQRLLTDLDLDLPTRVLPRGTYPMATIDHISLRDASATAIPIDVSRRLSDHDAYVVTSGLLPTRQDEPCPRRIC